MIEAYAFLAMFTIQILIGSVLNPAWLIRRVRAGVASFPAERFAELFPGVDRNVSGQRFATRYRALNTGIAVLGLLLLGWLFSYMRRTDWREGPVGALATVYLFVQVSPLFYLGRMGARYSKLLRQSLVSGKRKAVLERRELFDFVSPFMVCLAVLSYFLFAAVVLYIRQHPFPGFGGLTNIVIITLGYALLAFVVYGRLYGRKHNPAETHADRARTTTVVVKGAVYTSIAATVFGSLNLTLQLLHLKRWEPFGLSVFFVICTLISSIGVIAPPRQPNADGFGGPLPPGTSNLSA